MKRGSAFRIVGFVLGIVGTVVSVTAIVFSVVGLLLAKKPVKPHIRWGARTISLPAPYVRRRRNNAASSRRQPLPA